MILNVSFFSFRIDYSELCFGSRVFLFQIKIESVITEAVISATGSATYIPVTPKNLGRIIARGISKNIFRTRAKNNEILASPRAKKVD